MQIAVGFCLALFAASFMLVLSIETSFLASGSDPAGVESGVVVAFAAIVGALFMAAYLAPLVAGPAAIAIVVAESARLGGLVANLLLGATVAAGTGWLAAGGAPLETSGSTVVLASGFAGGFVYWAICGRTTGFRNADRYARDG